MFAVVVTLAALAFPPMASADLIFDASILAPAQGFGTAPRDLTLQGANATESGAIGYNGTAIVFGSAVLDSSVFQGNGTTNSTSLADLPNPQGRRCEIWFRDRRRVRNYQCGPDRCPVQRR
jgi:hypothetical protein